MDSMMTGDKHVGGLRMTALENKMIVDEDKDVRTTPSMRQQTTLETGKPLLFPDIDTLPHTDVPGPKLLIRMDDKTRNLSEDNPIIQEPVSKVLGQEVVMDDDLPTQLTQREGVNTRMMNKV